MNGYVGLCSGVDGFLITLISGSLQKGLEPFLYLRPCFDHGIDLLVFLASVIDKTGYICQNDEGEGAAEVHGEIIDQSLRMLRSRRFHHFPGDRKKLISDHKYVQIANMYMHIML